MIINLKSYEPIIFSIARELTLGRSSYDLVAQGYPEWLVDFVARFRFYIIKSERLKKWK